MSNIKVRVQINYAKINAKKDRASKIAQTKLDESVLRDSNRFIPKDTGELEFSGFSASQIGSGLVAWKVPQVRRLYYNPQFNFSRDKNPNASGLWFEQAKSQNREQWLSDAKKTYRQIFDGK